MSNLENLKHYIGEPEENNNQNNDVAMDDNIQQANSKETEIEKNTKMDSKASSICEKLYLTFFLTFIVLLIASIVVEGPFFGEGLKFGNIFNLFKYDISTITANLMVRSFVLSAYLVLIEEYIIYKMTCKVCGHFFTGRKKLWSKYIGTNTETETSITKYRDGTSTVDSTTITNYDKFDVLYQCKYCGEVYKGLETKKSRRYHKY